MAFKLPVGPNVQDITYMIHLICAKRSIDILDNYLYEKTRWLKVVVNRTYSSSALASAATIALPPSQVVANISPLYHSLKDSPFNITSLFVTLYALDQKILCSTGKLAPEYSSRPCGIPSKLIIADKTLSRSPVHRHLERWGGRCAIPPWKMS